METRTATQMAKLYGMKSSTAFNKLLTECKVLRHTDKGFILDDSLQGKGYTTVVTTPYFLPSLRHTCLQEEIGMDFRGPAVPAPASGTHRHLSG